MKTPFMILGIIGLVIAGMAGTSFAFDGPHNESNTIACADCHGNFLSLPTDAICASCHTNDTGGGYSKISAPKVLNHSSATLGTTHGTWSVGCRDCHRAHYQDHQYSYTTQTHIATGTITSITPVPDPAGVTTKTTYGYNNLIIYRPEWADVAKWGNKSGNERGLVMYPDIAGPYNVVSAEIVSATPTTITVTGAPSAGAIVGDTFALVYGQLIRTNVNAPFGTVMPKLFSNTGQNSFANDESGTGTDPTPDGVCQVCHTKTQHWRRDGALAANHSSGDNCTACHKHEEGFAPNCNTCHGFPPITNVQGPDGLVVNGGGTGSASPGTHATHAMNESGAYGFACETCHSGGMLLPISNKKIDIGFNISPAYQGGRYDGRTLPLPNGYSYAAGNAATTITNGGEQSCTNIYCHSNAKIGTLAQTYAKPTWNNGPLTCAACHQYPPAYDNGGAGTPTANSHVIHAVDNGFGCQKCHNKTVSADGASLYVKFHADTNIDVNFDADSPAGTYSAATKTCSNISCHGSGAPQWGASLSADCTACHGGNAASSAPISLPGHPDHMNNAVVFGTNYFCAECHSTTVSIGSDGTITGPDHANNTKDVSMLRGGSWNAGTKNCSTVYCHSSGKGLYVNPPLWGSSANLVCNSCHGTTTSTGAPDYANAGAGLPNANSHAQHAGSPADCATCHANTTTSGTAIKSGSLLHTNGSIDLTFEPAKAGAGATWTSGTKTCSNVACHGSGTPQWGAAGLACQSCHLGAADLDNFSGAFWDNGIAGVIGNAGEWDTTGHGKAAGTYASGNVAAGFTNPNACLYCHDSSVMHKTAANPFRLRNIAGSLWGKNGNCQSCHVTGSAGVIVDGVLKNGASKIDSTHYDSKHGAANNGGQFCWDCHDPHGDSNIFMVHASVAKTSDAATGAPLSTVAVSFTAAATGTDYARSAAPYSGICNVCHTSTLHYTSTSGDGHNAATSCTQCHKHTGKTMTDAFSGGDCIGCHSVEQGKRAAVASQFSGNSHHIQGVALTSDHCYQCHWEANSDGSVNAVYHGGSSHSGSPVDLVIYGTGSRPTAYSVGTTAVEYTAGLTSVTTTTPGQVNVVDTWRTLTTSGSGASRTASFTAGPGTIGNRLMVVGIGWEDSNSSGCNPSSITGNYGGKAITAIAEANTSNNRVGQWMGYVRETDIASRSGNTITLTFAGCTPNQTPTLSAATYEGVDQASALLTVKASGTSGSSFSWSNLSVVSGGYAMYNLTADGISSFTPPSGYTERYDTSTSNFRMTGGDKAITADGTESRSVTGNTSSSRWALVAVSVKPASVTSTVDGSRTELAKINLHCIGCHSAKNDNFQPFGDGKTPKQYAWDNSSIDARYSQTGSTMWGKYITYANAAQKNIAKAYSAHGNAGANARGWSASTGVDGAITNTSGFMNVLCYDCHNSHGSTVAGKTTSYSNPATTNGAILKDTAAGRGGYAMTYKPVTGGSATTKNTHSAGAALCFDCHLTQNAGTKPWGYQGTFGSTQAVMGYFDTPYFEPGVPAGPQQRYAYKATTTQKGGHFGASSPLTQGRPVMGTIGGLCTPCHDPHGVSPTMGSNQAYGVPLLKGTWMTSPYKEDAAPLAINLKVGVRGESRNQTAFGGASTPGYYIDQNTFEPDTKTTPQGSGSVSPMVTWPFASTKRVTETVEQFGGLCLRCHPQSSIRQTTGGAWKSLDRVHNTVKGWGGSGANANNAVHSYTCSKCHAPHNSALNRLMVTNCLDYGHRGQRVSGGTAGKGSYQEGSSGSSEGGRGKGQFPSGGGGIGNGNSDRYAYFFGSTSGGRACHDNTNSGGYPSNQLWNTKTVW